uniref:SAM-dependent MTase TRM10-type domain-containing protein n=1 Tax=Strongyloides venezuelensis TaxID=75913 RepID=A0A0K0G1X2_STRVS
MKVRPLNYYFSTMLNLISKRSKQLLGNNGHIKRFCQSSTSKILKILFDQNTPKTILPSEDFIRTLDGREIRQKFSVLAGQINIFYKKSKYVPKVLNDDDWMRLLRMDTIIDRESFLCGLYYKENNESPKENNESPKENNEKISEINQKKFDKGEMVYARHFHQLIDCYGTDFRERINNHYGYKYYASYRNNEEIPKLLIDCRYLYKLKYPLQELLTNSIQKLWNYLWFKGYPFDVTLANVLTDPCLSDLIKKQFTFLYGSDGKKLERVEEDDNGYIMASESSYPFRPVMSVKKNTHFYDKSTNRVAFISSNAKQNLPDNLRIFDTFIIAPTDGAPGRDPMNIGITEKLPSFRIPIEKYVKWERGSKILNPLIIGKLLTSVYYKDMAWREALITHIPEYHLNPVDVKEKQAALLKRGEREKIKNEVRLFTFDYTRRKINLDNYGFLSKDDCNKNNSVNSSSKKRVRVHRYSREERNRRGNEKIL